MTRGQCATSFPIFEWRTKLPITSNGSAAFLTGCLRPWPKCKDCGRSQSLLAQFHHDDQRLNLGRPGRALFVFQCNHDPGMCSTWEAFSGANACFVVEPEELSASETTLPNDLPPLDHDVRIIAWLERNDGLPEAVADAFKNDRDYVELPADIQSKVTYSTRLGGIPRWIQSADEAPRNDWRFVAQLNSAYSFLCRPNGAYDWVQDDKKQCEGRDCVAEGPNFGYGLGYVFLRSTDGVPEGRFFWQR